MGRGGALSQRWTMYRSVWPLLLLLSCDPRNDVPYGACRASAECAAATPRCITFNNRITGHGIPLCTQECRTNADCPENGVCVNTETTQLGSLCVQRCSTEDSCRFAGAICPQVRPGEGGCVP